MANELKTQLSYENGLADNRRCYAIVSGSIQSGEVHLAFRTDEPQTTNGSVVTYEKAHHLFPSTPAHNVQNPTAGGSLILPLPDSTLSVGVLALAFVNTTDSSTDAVLHVAICNSDRDFEAQSLDWSAAVPAKGSFTHFICFKSVR